MGVKLQILCLVAMGERPNLAIYDDEKYNVVVISSCVEASPDPQYSAKSPHTTLPFTPPPSPLLSFPVPNNLLLLLPLL